MIQTRELFDSITTHSPLGTELRTQAADLLAACEEVTLACATGMLAEKEADELRTAINQDFDCADVTATTRRVLTRGTSPGPALLAALFDACRIACERSHQLCGHHAHHHEHCRICSETTRRTADMCREVLAEIR